MWPFSPPKRPKPVPAIKCGDIDITWSQSFQWWEFSTGGVDYTLSENPIFDPSVLLQLREVATWLTDLDHEIDQAIKQQLEGWCDWNGQKELVSIDVSWLASRRKVDIAFAHEDWADLGVNVVITEGAISSTYAGD